MHITIRPAKATDKVEISSLAAQLGYSANPEEVAQRLAVISEDKNACVYVAVSDQKVRGWIHGFYTCRIESAAFVEIGALVVAENFRGKGIGKKLVEQVNAWGKTQEVALLKVRCNT